MAEQLLTADEVAQRLGISRRAFYRRRLELISQGMQVRVIGQCRRYRAASIDRLIAADDEATAVIA